MVPTDTTRDTPAATPDNLAALTTGDRTTDDLLSAPTDQYGNVTRTIALIAPSGLTADARARYADGLYVITSSTDTSTSIRQVGDTLDVTAVIDEDVDAIQALDEDDRATLRHFVAVDVERVIRGAVDVYETEWDNNLSVSIPRDAYIDEYGMDVWHAMGGWLTADITLTDSTTDSDGQ